MIRFVLGVLLAALAGVGYAAALPALPYAQTVLIAALLLAALVAFAAAHGAPRALVVSHLYGLLLGALALWCLWVGAVALDRAAGGQALLDAALDAARLDAEGWRAELAARAQTLSFAVNDFVVAGATLQSFWIAEAALLLLAGLAGGHAGRRKL